MVQKSLYKVYLLTNISDIHLKRVILTQRQITSNGRRFDVNIMSIRRRPNFDEFPRHFHVLFRCNFADRKSTLFPRTFFDTISMVEKSMLFPLTFFDVILMEEKSTLSARTFFEEISMSKNLACFW